MCLFLQDQKQTEPLIAEKDIKVYKVLEENWDGRFISPFRAKHYRFNELYRNNIGAIQKENEVVFFTERRKKIESGLHSFINDKDAHFLV
jgi:hypothetical protein